MCLLQSLPSGEAGQDDAWRTFGKHGWHGGGRLFPPNAGAAAVEGGHATQARYQMQAYYTPELLRRVKNVYREDYKLWATLWLGL